MDSEADKHLEEVRSKNRKHRWIIPLAGIIALALVFITNAYLIPWIMSMI